MRVLSVPLPLHRSRRDPRHALLVRTASKKALGQLNQLAFDVEWGVQRDGWDRVDLLGLNRFLRRSSRGRDGDYTDEAEYDDPPGKPLRHVRVADVLAESGEELLYLYDYGDHWQLTLTLTGRRDGPVVPSKTFSMRQLRRRTR